MDSEELDFNLVVLAGRIAVPPDLEEPGDPAVRRLLLTVRSTLPTRRLDLIPVATAADAIPEGCALGDHLWVVGSLQRRFSATNGRSRIEVVAGNIERRNAGPPPPPFTGRAGP